MSKDGVRNDEDPAGHRSRQTDARLPDLDDPGIPDLAHAKTAAPGHPERFQQSEVVVTEVGGVEPGLRTRGELGELDGRNVGHETRQGARAGGG